MKVKKLLVAVLAMIVACSVSIFAFAGCGASTAGPTDFDFTLDTRAYSFNTVEGYDEYQIVIEKILNEATGKALVEGQSITRTEKGQEIVQPADDAADYITKPGQETSSYVWKTNMASALSIKDNDGDGKINGNLSIYQFQSKADGVTPTLLNPLDPTNPDEMPLGHYYISCYGIDADGNRSDPAWKEFVVGGKLAEPDFSYSVADGKMTVSITSSYINNAIRTEGLPYSIDVEIDDGSGSKKTVVFDNWAYYTTVIGPETSFNFMFLTQEIDVADADSYVVSAIARGDGGDIKDSDKVVLAPYKTSSDVPSDWFAQGASTVDLTATTSDGMTVTMKVDKDNGKWSVVGGSSNKYYGSTWGTMTESEGTYTLTTVGGGDYATVSSFAVTELNDDGEIKKASASITVASTSRLNSSLEDVPATVTASYEERSQSGPGGNSGGDSGPPM